MRSFAEKKRRGGRKMRWKIKAGVKVKVSFWQPKRDLP